METLSTSVRKIRSIIDNDYMRGPYVLTLKVIEAKHRTILQEIHHCDVNNRNYPESLRKEIEQCIRTVQNLREEMGITNREAYI
jgi:hypothetical protein